MPYGQWHLTHALPKKKNDYCDAYSELWESLSEKNLGLLPELDASLVLMRSSIVYSIAVLVLSSVSLGQSATEIQFLSAADNSMQPAMFYDPGGEGEVPMVVALHSWSSDYKQTLHKDIEVWCIDKGWAYLHPDFRGRNLRPEATGSELVVQDIVSSVEHAKRVASVDPSSIYLVGTSGGGYACLLMAGRHPDLWAGISAWVPIFDLKAWYFETKERQLRYAGEIVASCGGAPGDSPKVDAEYWKRSPIAYMENAKGVNLHINTGIRDGHDGSVPISHSLLAFNAVADRKDRLRKRQIRHFVEKAEVPKSLRSEIKDASYGEKQPLFRRSSESATVTVFDGDHELISSAAIAWIEKLHERKEVE